MNEFKIHDINTAPADSRAALERIKGQHGYIHNVYAIMAESPALLKGHAALLELFEKTNLSDKEREVVLLTASRENASDYSVAYESENAKEHQIDTDMIDALRSSKPLKDRKLEMLRKFTVKLVHSRAQISEQDVRELVEVGYTRANILEIVLAVGMVTLTNYTNLIAKTPLDKQLEALRWRKTA
ncbi:MAG: carboxymuconolactone decarboxylase family protein [Bacillota bacterium]